MKNRLTDYEVEPPAPVPMAVRVLRMGLAFVAVLVMLGVSVFVGACAARQGWGP